MIYLLGSGVDFSKDLTRYTLHCVAKCRTLYVLHRDAGILDFLGEFCADVRSCNCFYEKASSTTDRSQIYMAIAATIIDEASQGPVGLMVEGNPMTLVSANEYIVALACRNGLSCEVVPAVSSLDAIFCELRTDPFYALQIFDTSTFLRNGSSLQPTVPVLFTQLTTTLNPNFVMKFEGHAAIKRLADTVANTYGSDHTCFLVYVANSFLDRTSVSHVRVRELVNAIDQVIESRPSLFVPALAGASA